MLKKIDLLYLHVEIYIDHRLLYSSSILAVIDKKRKNLENLLRVRMIVRIKRLKVGYLLNLSIITLLGMFLLF